MFNQREVFRGAEIRALVRTMISRRIWWESFSAHGGTIPTVAAHGAASGDLVWGLEKRLLHQRPIDC